MQNEGIMLPGPHLQLGFKSEFRGHRGKIGIYYGNLSPQTINMSCAITADDALKLSTPDRAGEAPSTLPPRGQALQMVQTECTAPFSDAPLVTLSYSQEGGATQNVSLRLPIPPFRFLQPSAMTGDEYFRTWRTAGLAESQSSFHFTGQYDPNTVRRVLSEALHLAVLNGVDPVPSNFVASGSCALRGTGTGANAPASGNPCLLRLEVNPNYQRAGGGPPKAAARLTVRSDRGVAASIVNALAALWGGVTPP
jgi:AP-2 complex subunit alpha